MHRLGPHGRLQRAQRPLTIRGQRGVALLLVLGLLALLGTVVADFQFSSRVDLQLAYNARDELQAEANALSALRMRALILKQASKLQATLKALSSSMGTGAVPPIGQLLEMIPVECGLMSAITKRAGPPLSKPQQHSKGGHVQASKATTPKTSSPASVWRQARANTPKLPSTCCGPTYKIGPNR